MEAKKSPKAILGNKRVLFLEIGLAFALILVLAVFEWCVDVSGVSMLQDQQEMEAEEEMIPITRQEPEKPPPLPPAVPKIADVLNIVDNGENTEDELDIEDSDADIDEEVVIQVIEEEEEAQVFVVFEEIPEFPGGQLELRKWIARSIKYPVIARKNGIAGCVYVSFVINNFGGVEQVRIARGASPSLDKEAVRVIESMPKWNPTRARSKLRKASFIVPINFQLQ